METNEERNVAIIVYHIYFPAGPFLSLIDRALVKARDKVESVREWTRIYPGERLASSGHFQSDLDPY